MKRLERENLIFGIKTMLSPGLTMLLHESFDIINPLKFQLTAVAIGFAVSTTTNSPFDSNLLISASKPFVSFLTVTTSLTFSLSALFFFSSLALAALPERDGRIEIGMSSLQMWMESRMLDCGSCCCTYEQRLLD